MPTQSAFPKNLPLDPIAKAAFSIKTGHAAKSFATAREGANILGIPGDGAGFGADHSS
jgi:hypothetical protein